MPKRRYGIARTGCVTASGSRAPRSGGAGPRPAEAEKEESCTQSSTVRESDPTEGKAMTGILPQSS